MVRPLAVGWHRAALWLSTEDGQAKLAEQLADLEGQIEYVATDEGKASTIYDQIGRARPGGREIPLEARPGSQGSGRPKTLTERAASWRQDAQTRLYDQWRVFVLCACNKRLPPPADRSDEAAAGPPSSEPPGPGA